MTRESTVTPPATQALDQRRPTPRRTVRLTMGQALVRYLQVQSSERDGQRRRLIPAALGIFGHGNVTGLGQALESHGRELPFHQPKNEQSAVHTAVGYAKANLRLATLACTASIGPGSTNMVTGAALATVNRLPVLLLPGDYYASRRQGHVLQQLEHPVSADLSVNDCFRPVSRYFDRIVRPEHLLTALPEAMRALTDPAETGAVVLALPQDVQCEAWDYPEQFFTPRAWTIERRVPDESRIDEAARLIARARRPMIIAGGGVLYSQAGEQLQAFAEAFGIPVGETMGGKGAMPRPSALSVGAHGVEGTAASGRIAAAADLVIAIGTRLGDFATGSQSAFRNPDVAFIGINVGRADAHKQNGLAVVGDAREALLALSRALSGLGAKPDASYLREILEVKRAWAESVSDAALAAKPGEAMNQGELIRVLQGEAQSGDTIVVAAGSPPGDVHKLWDATGGRDCHIEFGFSCMGYEIPAGLGVRLAREHAGKGGEVVVLVGDGTYLMNPTELVTAAQEGLKITVVIADNHGYQVIRRLQMWRTGRSFGNEFRSRDARTNRLDGDYVALDLAKTAAGFGARSWRVSDPAQLRDALREARGERRPCVIVAEIEKHRFLPGSGVWWDAAPAEVSDDPLTRENRAGYERERAELQRFHY
jgi:3D-(3,5/4)-trihydroxycyclohexane-1,2-dione acylhydrolase (decyclizing)